MNVVLNNVLSLPAGSQLHMQRHVGSLICVRSQLQPVMLMCMQVCSLSL